jgi:hypothetical protein
MSTSSEYRFEKRRARAELTLATGTRVHGSFFLASSSQSHTGPERVGDLLNTEPHFFPFELESGQTALYNRAQVVLVRLPEQAIELQLEPGYEVATRRVVAMLMSNGERVVGTVSVFRPTGRDRLSDYARADETFRYVETGNQTLIVNSAHVVEIREIAD